MTGEPIPTVDYTFDVQGGPNPEWSVRRFHLTEGLSQTYTLIVDVVTEEVGLNPDELLGANARLDIDRHEVMRQVAGVIHRVDYVGVNVDRKLALRIYVVPALRLLAQDLGSRIYQDRTVPEILEEVLGEGLSPFEREVDLSGLSTSTADYPKRDYCVRLRESVLDFVSRLMEEDGIAYYFRFVEDKEVLVLVDQSSGDPNTAFPEAEFIDPDAAGSIPIITDRPDQADRDSLRYFDWCQPLRPNQVMVRSFNWKAFDPAPDAALETSEPSDAPKPLRRQYVFAAGRKAVDEKAGAEPTSSFDGTAIDEPALEAKRRYELYASESQLGRGGSNVVGFYAGARFTIDDRSFTLLDQLDFLLTRVTHRGENPQVEVSGGSDGTRYENTFECIPVGKPFRPARVTPSPRVFGPQTATVTGGSGEEIHTDKHGRIKVRFHWDEHSKLDDGSSCWVRVAQMWAGPGWGTLFLPRVGMEVVVEFLDGNPDRPLVTGCVYNSTNTPPYPLPAEKTKSTLKSNSSVGGGGFNELRFEDAKGSEELFIHAQKDMNEVVLNDHSTTVGHNQTHNVDVDRTRTVKGNEVVTIEGNQTIIINGSPCGGSKSKCEVKGNHVTVNDTYKLHADNQILLDAPNLFKLTVGGSTITVDPTTISICAGGGSSIVLDSKIVAASSGKSTITMTGDINAKANSGSTLDLMGNAQLKSNDGSFLNLTGNADLKANAGANIVLTGDATVNGGTVTLAGKTGKVVADGSGVGVSNGAIVIKGTTVSIDGGGATGSFAGGVVKLN